MNKILISRFRKGLLAFVFLAFLGGSFSQVQAAPLPLGESNYDDILTSNKVARILESEITNGELDLQAFVKKAFGSGSNVIKIANMILGVVAILYIVIIGIRMITAQGDEESLNTQKKHMGYVILGLLLLSLNQFIAFDIVGIGSEESDVLGAANAQSFYESVMALKTYVQIIIGSIATVALIISGFQMLTSQGRDDLLEQEKQFLKNFLLGVILIILAEVLVRGIFAAQSPDKSFDTGEASNQLITQIVGLTNFVLTFVAAASVFMTVLASIYFVLSFGDEERTSSAKKIIVTNVVAIIIALSSYSLIRFFF